MQNIMQECIHKQQEALKSVLAHAETTIPPFIKAYEGKPVARVVLIGAGSSYHALNMARPICQQAMDVPVFAATPAQLGWLDQRFAEDTLVIAASQSGTSSNTLAAIKALQALGFSVSAITQVADSLIAQQADCHVLLAIPEEKAGPKTMGVLGTMLTCQKMLIALAKKNGGAFDDAAFDADMQKIVENLPGNIAVSMAWCEASQDDFAASPAYCVVAQGENAGIAGEGALKLVETVRLPVTPYELEEIVHGPLLAFRAKPTLLYLGTPWEEGKRPEALGALCAEQGGRVFTVTLSGDKAGFDGRTLTLRTAGNPLLIPYELLIPPQVISAYVPPVMGIDLDARSRSAHEAALAGHL